MERRAAGDQIGQSEDQAEDEREAKEEVGGERGGPHFACIDASDDDLAIGEFKQALEGCVHKGDGKTLGKEENWFAATLERVGHGVIVANGALPFFEDAALIEFGAANCRAATPAEIAGVVAEHGDNGSIPCGEQHRREIAVIRDEPAHGGDGAVARVIQRPHHFAKPGSARAAIGIDEDKRIEFRRQFADGVDQIVHFFAAALGASGVKNVRFDAGLGSNAFDGRRRGIGFRSENKKDFVVLVVEFTERDEILFEALFEAAAGTDDSGARRIETGIEKSAAFRVGEPQHTLHGEVDAEQNLEHRENFEKNVHARRA